MSAAETLDELDAGYPEVILRPATPKLYEAWSVLTNDSVDNVRAFYENDSELYAEWRRRNQGFKKRRAFFTADRRKIKWTAQGYWEALAAHGVIPMNWVNDPHRLFEHGCRACGGRGYHGLQQTRPATQCGFCAGTGFGVYPQTLDAALTFATNPQGMLTAEQLVREGLPRTGRQQSKMYWRTVNSEDYVPEKWKTWLLANIRQGHHGPGRLAINRLGYDVGLTTLPRTYVLLTPPAA